MSKMIAPDTQDRVAAWQETAHDAGEYLPEAVAASDLGRLFAFSEYAARQSFRNPGMVRNLVESGDLDRLYAADEYDQRVSAAVSAASDEDGLNTALRRLRHREMVRIAWRDLSGRADLFETMSELSAFARACVSHVLEFLHLQFSRRFGSPLDADGNPQQLVVFAMGKLGGQELNFSSDIDLMFAYPEVGQTAGGEKSISNEEFFTRLARRLIDVISKSTAEGFLFRVDTRLRPYGDAGPLVNEF